MTEGEGFSFTYDRGEEVVTQPHFLAWDRLITSFDGIPVPESKVIVKTLYLRANEQHLNIFHDPLGRQDWRAVAEKFISLTPDEKDPTIRPVRITATFGDVTHMGRPNGIDVALFMTAFPEQPLERAKAKNIVYTPQGTLKKLTCMYPPRHANDSSVVYMRNLVSALGVFLDREV